MGLQEFATWLQATRFSLAIQTTEWMVPLLQSVHIVMIGVVFVLAMASALRYYLVTTLGERIVSDLREEVFSHLTRLSPSFFDRSQTGEMMSRLTADTTQIKAAVGASVSVALRNLVLFLGAEVRYWLYDGRIFGNAFTLKEVAIDSVLYGGLALSYAQRARASAQLLVLLGSDEPAEVVDDPTRARGADDLGHHVGVHVEVAVAVEHATLDGKRARRARVAHVAASFRPRTRAALSWRNFGHTWSRNGTLGISEKMRS